MKLFVQLVLLFSLINLSAKAQQQFQILYHPFPTQKLVYMKHAIGGGFLLESNFTDSSGEQGILFTRFDEQLNISWEKSLNEIGNIENSHSFCQDSTGNIYLVGSSGTTNNQIAMIVKADSTLNIHWKKEIYYQNQLVLNKLLILNSNSLYFLGQTIDMNGAFVQDSLVLMHADSSGLIDWCKTYGANNGWNFGIDLMQGSNNNLILGNWDTKIQNFGGLSSYDLTGLRQWDNRWAVDGSNFNPFGDLEDIIIDGTGGFALFGTKGNNIQYEARTFIMLCNNSGNQTSWQEFGIDYNGTYYALYKIKGIRTTDGSYLLTGNISLPNLDYRNVLMKVDSNLIPQWCMLFELPNINYYDVLALNQSQDGGYIIAGSTANNIFIIKTGTVGNSGCNDTSLTVYSQPSSSFQITYTGEQAISVSSLNFIPVTLPFSNINSVDTLCSTFLGIQLLNENESITISPNPASHHLQIQNSDFLIKEIEIINFFGENIYSTSVNRESCIVNCASFPPGLYFVKITTENMSIVRKIIKI